MLKTLTTLIRGFFSLIFLRLIPLLIIVGIVWSGYQVAEGLYRQIEERMDFEDRQAQAPAAATAIAQSGAAPEATPEVTIQMVDDPESENVVVAQAATDVTTTEDPVTEQPATDVPTETPIPPTATETLTNTPEPTETPVPPTATIDVDEAGAVVTEIVIPTLPGIMLFRATFTPEATATLAPSDTPVPPTATDVPTDTPEPTATDVPTNTTIPSETPVPPTATDVPTDTPVPPTNTPEPSDTPTDAPLVFATNTPVGGVSPASPTPTQGGGIIFATNTPADGGDDNDTGDAVSQGGATSTLAIESVPDTNPTEAATVAPTEVQEQAQVATAIPPSETSIPPTQIPATPTPVPPEPTANIQPTATNTLPPFFAPRTPEPGTTIDGIAVPTEVPLVPREYNLFNLMLMGGDAEITNDGTVRTDTMIMVSINKDTNTVSMMSLPRDLYVYVPTENGAMRRLNTVYGMGESMGWQPSPFDLLRQTIAYNFGVNVHHFALVNFDGFQEIIDTLGGVPIAVDCAYQDYRLIGAELPEGAEATEDDEFLFTVDVGYYNMSGAQALWYARTRRSATDFDRGRRQQQILRAMWSKALDTGQLASLPQLWGQAQSVMTTSVDLTDVLGLLPIALDLEVGRIRSYTLALGYHTQPMTVTGPDGIAANVHLPVYDTMRPLLEAFYRPPNNSQILVEGATIAIYNGTDNADWDDVAAERLAWEGFQAFSAGQAEGANDNGQTILIDHTGATKGSSRNEIAAVLNVRPENIVLDPDPNRQADFEVILGDNYNSCTYDGVLEVE